MNTPLPDAPYAPDILTAYLNAHVQVVGKAAHNSGVREPYLDFLKRLPGWMQVIMVETRSRFELGYRAELAFDYSHGKRELNGQYLADKNLSRIALEGRGIVTSAHEFGHGISSHATGTEMERNFNWAAKTPLSQRPAWEAAFEAEQPLRHKLDFHRGEPLYANYRTLGFHLSLNYKPEEYLEEALAEMSTHVAVLHELGKTPEAIDAILSGIHPHLWPAFRDDIVPEATRQAELLYGRRQGSIDYVINAMDGLRAKKRLPPLARSDARHEVGLLFAARPQDLGILSGLLDDQRLRPPLYGRDKQKFSLGHLPVIEQEFPEFAYAIHEESGTFRAVPDFLQGKLSQLLGRWIDYDHACDYTGYLAARYGIFRRLSGIAGGFEDYAHAQIAARVWEKDGYFSAWHVLRGQKNKPRAKKHITQLKKLAAAFNVDPAGIFATMSNALYADNWDGMNEKITAMLNTTETLAKVNQSLKEIPFLQDRARKAFHDTHARRSMTEGEKLERIIAFVHSRGFGRLQQSLQGLCFAGPAYPAKGPRPATNPWAAQA